MSGCAVDKGFESLGVYNYFDAKQRFERVEKRKIVPSSYGLSIIYQRNDNPFYNLDSALLKINSAYSKYSSLSENKKEKYQKYGLDSLSILKQRSLISTLYFNRAVETNSVYGFQEFIMNNSWSPDIRSAINLRDSVFFFENHEKGGAIDYELFMTTYPNSIYYTKADKLYNKAFFKEKTINNSIVDYQNYLKLMPNGDFVMEAQNSIFNLSTIDKSLVNYSSFITNYPENRNINKAWGLLFDRYMVKSYSTQTIEQFKIDYPSFPFKNKITNELLMSGIHFYKYKMDTKWGFISEEGTYCIEPKYDFVDEFSEGLAVINLEGKVGYITKSADLKIKPQFDDGFSFENGFAVIELNGLFGLINRSGEYIVNPIYDDLGNVNDGLFYFEKNEKIGFFNTIGEEVIFAQYSDVKSFKNKLAIVERNGKYGVIDTNGNTKIEIKYNSIKLIKGNQFIVHQDSLLSVITDTNEIVLPFEFDYIGLESDGFVLVEKGSQFNYWDVVTEQLLSEVWFENYAEHRIMALFTNGFAKIKTNKGYNFINRNAEFVFNKSYTNLGKYATYIAFKSMNGWGYLNLNGNVIVKPNYTKTNSFSTHAGIVQLNENKGVIDEKGEILLPIYFEELTLLNDTLVIVKNNNRYGVLSNFRDTTVSVKYNFIERISSSIVKVSSDRELTYYNFETNNWLKKEE